MAERLIVGLGNPGPRYERTRHNAGFLLLDRLISSWSAVQISWDGPGAVYEATVGEHTVFLLKPATYMNLSGEAVASFFSIRALETAEILVAYDDVALPLGALRIRPGGSSGGQKGMRHIIETLDTTDVPRLRIGIDRREEPRPALVDFVLGEFTGEEVPLIGAVLDLAAEAATQWLSRDMEAVMAAFNSKTVEVTKPLPGGEF